MFLNCFLTRVCLLVLALGFMGCPRTDSDQSQASQPVPIRIGWQTPLATQGQVVQVLKREPLLEKHQLAGQFTAFSYGGPQTEAALAGELDVIFVGDQPAINLIARGGKWKIVARLFYTKTAIMVPLSSPIQQLGQLRNATVASPFGSVAHREATLKEQAAGLRPEQDVKNINMDILEISSLVQAGGNTRWGNIDAVAVWEPTTSLLERQGFARAIDTTRTLGVIAMSDVFIQHHRPAAVAFLQAVKESWTYFASHKEKVNRWYLEDARLSYTSDVLDAAAQVEPNYLISSDNQIDLHLTSANIKSMERSALWAADHGFVKSRVNIRQAVDLSLLAD